MVSPKEKLELEQVMHEANIDFEEYIENVQELLDSNAPNLPSSQESPSDLITFDEYHSYEDLTNYIDDLASLDPENMKVVSLGQTFEERDLWMLQISKAGPNAPIVYIEGGYQSKELRCSPIYWSI